MTRVHAFGDDALGDLDAVGLVSRIQDRGLSVPEVVEAAIARVERVDPKLNAVAHAAFDRARDEARSPRGGYFAGVPTFLKDNVDVARMPTQQGSDAFVGPVQPRDGDLARMLLATGPVPLGKTRLPSSPRAPYPWRTRTTAAGRSGSRPRSTGWSGSSPAATGSPRTSSCGTCRCGSSPTGC